MLGLLAFCVFVVAVISLAASISWVVVKLTPAPGSKRQQSQPDP